MNYRHLRLAIPALFLATGAMLDCKGSDRAGLIRDPDVGEFGMGGSGGTGGSGGRGGGGRGGSAGEGGEADAGLDAGPTNCGNVNCRGAGKCEVVDGEPTCVCDRGYVLTDGECVIDEYCIELRRLEHGCRQRLGAEPAISMFFGLETCAGTSVRPEIVGDVNQAFKVKEDGFDLGEESYATIFDRDVESLVVVALDLSASVANDSNLLVPLINELKTFFQALEPDPGQPSVRVGLMSFGRTVHVIRSLTTDFAAIAADLDAIAANPGAAVADPGGTNLVGAVNDGVSLIEDEQEVLLAANLGAIVNVGTVISVTDGRDTSGGSLSTQPTVVNRISIGISSEIDDSELSRVGPQGSYLAPEPADWTQAFQRVAERVEDYPNRAYLLSYCSPAVTASHSVVVTLANQVTTSDATCSFNAALFGSGAGNCNAAFVNDYCDSRACGSFLACGECTSDAGTPTRAADDLWSFGPR